MTVVCQDRDAHSYDFVDEFYGPKDTLPTTAPLMGTIRVITPDIGGLLPVYVYDKYEGYTVKTIPNCTEQVHTHTHKCIVFGWLCLVSAP